MSDISLDQKIADLKKAMEAQENLRSVLGDSVVETTLTVLQDQIAEFEKQAGQQDAANQARRKLVTVLFADVSGFTAYSENKDAEDVANLLNRLWLRADRIIREHGGTSSYYSTIYRRSVQTIMRWGSNAASRWI